MRNIWTIFRNDMKRLSMNVMSVIIVAGLVLMPSIFTWYNVIACWNVFDNTGNLTVAVANVDEGYQSDLVPLRVNVGEQVVSALRANDQIDWIFTTEEDAVDGARAGRYYAAVVIPASFSRDMLTFYSQDSEHAKIIYYANEKKSAIAPKITDKGADSVSYQVNEVFAETLSELALSIAQALGNYADQTDAQGRIAVLSDHVRDMADQMDQTSSVLVLYGSLADASAELVESSANLVSTARDEASQISTSASQETSSVSDLVDALKLSVEDLADSLEAASLGFSGMSDQIDALFDTAGENAASCAAQMRSQADALDAQRERYQAVIEVLEGLREVVDASYAPALEQTISMMGATCDLLQATSDSLRSAAERLETGDVDVQGEREELKALMQTAEQSISEAKRSFEEDLKPAMADLAEDAATFAACVSDGAARLDAVSGELAGSAGSVSGVLATASSEIDATSASLGEVSEKLRALADGIDGALASGDVELLREILGSDVQSLARALAAPVGVERVAMFPSENFGSAMAPLYTTLALFIGSLLILVVVKPAVSERAQASLVCPRPFELFFGRFGVMAFISLLQTTLMGLGNLYFLQVQVAHPLLFMLCFWVAGLVFTLLIYALVAVFANLGKAVAVLLLIVQVTGCGGSFPLQLLPGFIQAISPFLPATHVVNAMRAAMFGVWGNDYWVQLGEVALFVIPALFIGLVLRGPLSKFMGWYVEKVEDSKLVG